MTFWYLDTSAALKLLLEERESQTLATELDYQQPDLVACLLLETELRRSAQRSETLGQHKVSTFLEGVGLYELPPSLFQEAGLLAGPMLRSLDALHLSAAIRIGADCVLTYDHRMQAAAHKLGLEFLAPGVD